MTLARHVGDGDKKPGSPGRARRKPLKPLRGECRAFSGVTVVTTCVLSTFAYEAAGALRASGFPCALYLEGIRSNLGRHRVARSRFAVLGCLTREQDRRPTLGHGIVPGPAAGQISP